MTAFVWDPNPFNPYGLELARVISETERVFHFSRRRAESIGFPSVERAAVLPGAASGEHTLRHKVLYALGCAIFFAMACVRRPIVVAAWTHTSLETWILRVLCALRVRVVLVAHNLGSSRDEAGTDESLQRLRARAWRLVIHHASLAPGPKAPANLVVAPHPAYIAWAEATRKHVAHSVEARGALFMGGARADKGIDTLPVLSELLTKEGVRLTAILGRVSDEQIAELAAEAPTIELVASAAHMSERSMREAIDAAAVLIAPYRDVTASGTIMMALTCGLPVASYSAPTLDEVLPATWQVPQGAISSLAHSARVLSDDQRAGDAARQIAERIDAESVRAWRSILERAGR